jgi:hypothetical protein
MGSVVINGPSGNDEVDAVEGQTSPPATIMIATLKRWPQPPLTLGLNVTLWDWLGPPGTHSAQSAVIGRQLPLACRGRYGPGCRTLAFGGIAVGSKWDRGRECVFFLLHIPGALWSQGAQQKAVRRPSSPEAGQSWSEVGRTTQYRYSLGHSRSSPGARRKGVSN